MKRVQLHLNHCRDNILVQGRSGPPHHHGAFSDSECAINLRSVTTSITLGSRSLFSVYFVPRQSEIARSTTMTAMMMRMMRMMIMMWCDGIIAVQNHDNMFLAWVVICIGGCKLFTSGIRYLTQSSRPSTRAAKVSAWCRTFREVYRNTADCNAFVFVRSTITRTVLLNIFRQELKL